MSIPENNLPPLLRLPLAAGPEHACPYLPNRTAQEEFLGCHRLDPAVYQELMDSGFRRSGRIIYRPTCTGCRECVPLRVPVNSFRPSRSQRRVIRRNTDLRVEVGPPVCTPEKGRLYADYLRYQHDGTKSEDYLSFQEFLYTSPTDTLEMSYRLGARLLAVGIVDACPDCLSSVYCFFDPAEARRSLGVFAALCEIAECRRRGLHYWYAGYYVRESPRMNYKTGYRPHELLSLGGEWRTRAI